MKVRNATAILKGLESGQRRGPEVGMW
jgi:hypothetical protein